MISWSVYASPRVVVLQEQPQDLCFRGNQNDVVDMVARAVRQLSESGPELAFIRFMQPLGGYVRGELYVFVIDRQGNILANGANPRSVGNNVLEAQDRRGHYFVKTILYHAATGGTGWVSYDWISPCTGKMAQKFTYCETRGPFVVCAGRYHALEDEFE